MILDIGTRTIRDGDLSVSLTNSECRLLRILAQQNSVFSYSDLIAMMWPLDEPDSAMTLLKVFVHRIRRKLDVAKMQPILGTVWGRGYVLSAHVDVRFPSSSILLDNENRQTLETILASLPERHPQRTAADRLMSLIAISS